MGEDLKLTTSTDSCALALAQKRHRDRGGKSLVQDGWNHSCPILVNTGEYGITFLIVMANAPVAGVVIERAWRGAIVAGIILTLVHLSGAVALFADRGGSVVRLAYEWYEAVLGGMVCIVAGVGGDGRSCAVSNSLRMRNRLG